MEDFNMPLFCFFSGDSHSCHSDQSIDSVSSEAFSEPCYKCGLPGSSSSHHDDYYASQSPNSAVRNINSQVCVLSLLPLLFFNC